VRATLAVAVMELIKKRKEEAVNYFFDPILKHYFDFKGVATRKEYWLFFFFTLLFNVILGIIDAATGMSMQGSMGVLGVIFGLLIFVPSMAIMVRRLHDAGFSAWWLLLLIVPFGFLVLLILMVLPSKLEGNKYRQTLEMSVDS